MLGKANLAVQEFSFPAFQGDDLASLKIIPAQDKAADTSGVATTATATTTTTSSSSSSNTIASFTTPEFVFNATKQEENELQQERLIAKKQDFKIAPMLMEYRCLQRQ